MNQTVIISANPKSGSFSQHGLVLELKSAIESVGFQCEVHTDLDQMADRCRELIQSNDLRTVIAAGGDGTASKVASLIPHDIPLTLFPTGSENLLAKYFSIPADHDRLAQVVANLVENALKFATRTVHVATVADHGWAVATVRDDGPGISPQDLPHVFERLYVARHQPARAENSSGLGLAIVHQLVSAMGGQVWVTSELGAGTTFGLRIPAAD